MDFCSSGDVLRVLKLAVTIIKIIRIAIPLILIVIITIDYYEVIFNNNNKGLKECSNRALKRFIAALAIFFFPALVNLVGYATNELDFMDCINNATEEGINNAYNNTASDAVDTAIETELSPDIVRAENAIANVKDPSIKEQLREKIRVLKETIEEKQKEEKNSSEVENNKEEETNPIVEPTKQIEIVSGSSLKTYSASNGRTLNYYEIIPNNPTNKMPLIIYLHGDWEAEDKSRIEALPIYNYAKNSNKKFVFIAPHSPYKDWISNNITDALKELIDKTISDYNIDTNHIIIMGASRGAIGTWHMIAKYGSFFSAAVPISYYPTINGDASVYTNVPIYGVSGNSGDFERSINNGMIGMINKIKNAGGDAEMHTINGKSHNDIAQNLPLSDIFNWVLSK